MSRRVLNPDQFSLFDVPQEPEPVRQEPTPPKQRPRGTTCLGYYNEPCEHCGTTP